MLSVTAVCFVKAECVEEFLSIAGELVRETNKLDKGCIKYDLWKNPDDPLHFVMLEEWESQNALDEHMAAAHFVKLVPELGERTSKPIELTILEKAL